MARRRRIAFAAGVFRSGAWGSAHGEILANVIEVVKLYFVNHLDSWGYSGGVRTTVENSREMTSAGFIQTRLGVGGEILWPPGGGLRMTCA